MYEIDLLPVGDRSRSGDAITMRYSIPGRNTQAVVVIDGGFEDTGHAVVDHIVNRYQTTYVDLVISTHPDEDHISGLGVVMRDLNVGELWIHQPADHGHPGNSGARPATELRQLAEGQGAAVREPFMGTHALDGTILVAAPHESTYEALLQAQATSTKAAATPGVGRRLLEAARTLTDRALGALPIEIPFDDAGGTNPRNNSSTVIDALLDGHHVLFTADAGVPTLNEGLDLVNGLAGRGEVPYALIQVPHHGSRHNLDSATLDRLCGPITDAVRGNAICSVARAAEGDYPRGRIANGFLRRGYPVFTTGGALVCDSGNGAPDRPDLRPATPLPPLAEDD